MNPARIEKEIANLYTWTQELYLQLVLLSSKQTSTFNN